MIYFLDFEETILDKAGNAPYADAPEFLRALGNEAIVVTHGTEASVRAALAGTVRLTVLPVGASSKAQYLAGWPGYAGGEAVFADDDPRELEELGAAFPLMKLYEMRRDGAPGDGRWPVIRSLSELP